MGGRKEIKIVSTTLNQSANYQKRPPKADASVKKFALELRGGEWNENQRWEGGRIFGWDCRLQQTLRRNWIK